MDRHEVASKVLGLKLTNYDIAVISKALVFSKKDKSHNDVYEYPDILKLDVSKGIRDHDLLTIEFMTNGEHWERCYPIKSKGNRETE